MVIGRGVIIIFRIMVVGRGWIIVFKIMVIGRGWIIRNGERCDSHKILLVLL